MSEPIYQSDPDRAPDTDFEPGELEHAVVGNEGRMLDPRRTPVRVVDVLPATGHVVLEVRAFEDAGALWPIELERLPSFQFARGSPRAGEHAARELRAAVARLDVPLEIAVDPAARARTFDELERLRREAADALHGVVPPLDLASREGSPVAQELLRDHLRSRGLLELEEAFAAAYVSNPSAGEIVRGHRIVLAELGLTPYVGKVVRDPELLQGAWSRERRAEHLLARLAFVPELFRAAGHEAVTLWRGLASERSLGSLPPGSFVSATFAHEVAEALLAGNESTTVAVLQRQVVPGERLFMTYVETEAMNRPFQEAEAVLLVDPENRVF